jgi:methylmalonyl-CoA carboxyltransferase large subunit
MATDKTDLGRIADALETLRQEVARLGQRVAVLEGRAGSAPASPPPVAEELSEELVLVLSAAIAAYLGKKAPIRAIRLLGSAAWSHQGRATIQASHDRVLSRTGR